ncbi:patatin-like phospholipase [Aspergillus keveii]|uniref:Patatin-like phospholipase n=1 Tax=Aspergillus keveii TaxID=714993 RepID=A0ABR4FL99_9EURO
MYAKVDSSWLEIGTSHPGVFVRDHGRLGQIVSELTRPSQQFPFLSVFLGGKKKDDVLQGLFPHNNIRRTRPHSSIGLRCETLSAETSEPIMFADGDVTGAPAWPRQVHPVPDDHPVQCRPAVALPNVYTRLIFPFTHLVFMIVADFDELMSAAQFLVSCISIGPTTTLPRAVRPKVVIFLGTDGPQSQVQAEPHIAQFYREINQPDVTRRFECFSTVNVTFLDYSLPAAIRYDRLRDSIKAQRIAVTDIRRGHRSDFNARHLVALFQSALVGMGVTPGDLFDFARATRHDRPVPVGLSHHVSHFLKAGVQSDCSLDALISAVASALLIDHYVPDMMLLDPLGVFSELYRPFVAEGVWNCRGLGLGRSTNEITALVQEEFVKGFYLLLASPNLSSVAFRKQTLLSLSHELSIVKSHTICLYCLVRSAQHSRSCHHGLCDICAQLFGSPVVGVEYRFEMSTCLLCPSSESLTIDVLPPTMNPTVLAIDGGGVRGVIPLEYLLLVQESLGPGCKVQDLIDLGIGPSSGGLIILGLIGMGWEVSTCIQMFDRLARRIFHERRTPALSWLPRLVFGKNSALGTLVQWLSWFFHDSCYDGQIFDASLREAFPEDRRIFGDTGHRKLNHSWAKFAVVATNIAKETRSYIFGNFNADDWIVDERHEYELFRATHVEDEPLIWEAARATAAAPFYFSTADLGSKGTFQDGGLNDNFAADIARRVARRIWPSRPLVTRLVSIGTGMTPAPEGEPAKFHHVFRNGFLQRGYAAFMSQMDTTAKWLKMRNELDESARQDYLRLDVSLSDIPCTIDNASLMDDYRNLVIRQPGASCTAREVAMALLAGRFYFVVHRTTDKVSDAEYKCWYGVIRCKGPVKEILGALQRLQPEPLGFSTDTDHLGRLGGTEDICSTCGRYCRPVTLLVRHDDEILNVYLRINRQRRWRISGFPSTLATFAKVQRLDGPFGRPDHGLPPSVSCSICDRGTDGLQGKRRRGTLSTEEGAKKGSVLWILVTSSCKSEDLSFFGLARM